MGPMDEGWDADVEIEGTPGGAFVAVLVLTPPPEIGPPVRWPVPGEYDSPLRAECAAMDAFTAMARGAQTTADAVAATLRPLTVLFGENRSGTKTGTIQV